ncbi:MAG: hypothetical protein DMG26_10160 [Acidobacteria bacterium]|nr:MAG: hypothetical protein DMG26_10160 [Acidobacteriota bacterium]PYV26798.1 MAG: hypothetical protein DMG27_05755 [Acidobacteriota bacterium]
MVAPDKRQRTPDPTPVRKRGGRSISSVPAVTASFAFVLLTLLVLGACKRSSKHAANRPARGEPRSGAAAYADRREAAIRLKDAIERAGGSEVWVKGAPGEAFPPPRADIPIEVLAPPRTFQPVLSALKTDSSAQGLEARAESTHGPDGSPAVEVRVFKGSAPVGAWRFREVRQLLRAAIVIDDLGQNLEAARQLLELPYPLTFSVLPRLPHSRETAEEAHGAGREVMLHLPMEPETGSRAVAGDGAIKVGMPNDQVIRIVDADVAAVPYARGANNHMGSRATADRALMTAVMKALAERRMYFVDSRTSVNTVAFDVARSAGVPTFYRSVFLDDTKTPGYTLGQLRQLCRAVRQQGAALAIGHPYPTTLAALRQFLPELEREDIQLVPASQLVRSLEVARLSPPRPHGGQ